MNILETKNAPGAIGPYSQGYEVNGFIFTSGQIPVDPARRRDSRRHRRPGGAELQERGSHFGRRRNRLSPGL